MFKLLHKSLDEENLKIVELALLASLGANSWLL